MMRDGKGYGVFFQRLDMTDPSMVGSTPADAQAYVAQFSDIYDDPEGPAAGTRFNVTGLEGLIKVPASLVTVAKMKRGLRAESGPDPSAILQEYDMQDPADEADLRALMATPEWTFDEEE